MTKFMLLAGFAAAQLIPPFINPPNFPTTMQPPSNPQTSMLPPSNPIIQTTMLPPPNPMTTTMKPTKQPTMSPSVSPTMSPSPSPTGIPTFLPSMSPTLMPTAGPTKSPTFLNKFIPDLPINADDFGQPDWAAIIETAFPAWEVPANGCPRLANITGDLELGFETFPTPEEGKFNPCYYTKAFAGLDPKLGGYPTPIDTKYPYEFAAPFFKQPGDGSTHHCPMNAAPDTPVQSCKKVGTGGCGEGVKDCNKITEEFGIGHVPPFVPLAAVKNAFLSDEEDVCTWFNEEIDECSIKKSVLDRLVKKYFGTEDGQIKFTPPKILPNLPASDPKSTYYKLEYLDDPIACAENNCRGPHYCSKAAADADIWGDFCPYIHTGENSGLYRHPHIALASFELWIANKCKPAKCPSTWLDSPNGKGYGTDATKSTSITWCEMENNDDPMAQPAVPYKWPNSGKGIYPGHELYGNFLIKPAPGNYVTKFVAAGSGKSDPKEREYQKSKGECRPVNTMKGNLETCMRKKMSEDQCKAMCDADPKCYAFHRKSKKKSECCLYKGGFSGNDRKKFDCFVATEGVSLAAPRSEFEEAMRSPLDQRLKELTEALI